ncbi:hypothetical protein SISSUDRAFT_92426 [Sistotremastrum suecicum HHB10207 ss-3]|uniref:F-box domain-containing protein n=1 Tax=Sistotremastrum suecicum HHB10207 ss-3 TaxID=1314776 RepID=A0A166B9B2_9AGAM|nr:hypothetical protein SISSUDRAFT_92426 [Sistotremastrum suecicum HHB10207 ss-3]
MELPFLSSLNVDSSGHDHENADYTVNAPNLCEFRYHGMLDHVFLVPFENLVKFTLESFVMETHEVLDLLSHVPQLEICDIVNVDPPTMRLETPELPVVVLGKLRSLSVRGLEVSDMASLIQHLDVPLSATLSFKTYGDDPPATTIEDFVATFLADAKGLSISFKLTYHESETTYALTSHSRNKISIKQSLCNEEALKYPEFEALSRQKTSITTLTLHSLTLPIRSSLIEALGFWTLLTRIEVFTDETEFEKLLIALEAAPEPICPQLRTLNCSGTRFSSTRMKYFLQYRKDHGVPLQELEITKGFAEPNVHAFVSLIPTLTEFDPDLSRCGFDSPWIKKCNCNLGHRDEPFS